jgi:biopolymer transport protein ExbB
LSRFLDTWLPWLADLLDLGGPILLMILLIASLIWALLFERFYFLQLVYPRQLILARDSWRRRRNRTSWFAQQHRNDLLSTLGSGLLGKFTFISTLIKVCPLLGLLGTVLGMLEVFDALAATGSNNPRSMASGVSKATVSTLAGMVVAIVGLLAYTLLERHANQERSRLGGYFESTPES